MYQNASIFQNSTKQIKQTSQEQRAESLGTSKKNKNWKFRLFIHLKKWIIAIEEYCNFGLSEMKRPTPTTIEWVNRPS